MSDPARDPGAGAAQEAGGQAGRHTGPADTEPHHAARGGEMITNTLTYVNGFKQVPN